MGVAQRPPKKEALGSGAICGHGSAAPGGFCPDPSKLVPCLSSSQCALIALGVGEVVAWHLSTVTH